MKFKVGDKVIITSGKDKGKEGTIVRVLPKLGKVIVEGMNLYTRHMKPMQGRAGEMVRKERPLGTAKIAIVNDKGQADRIGYNLAKDGSKQRVFKKTGKVIPAVEKKVTAK